ncbi:MAG: haloacid dehalogenase [Sphingomonas sp. 28-62-20]|uniref:HAD family hydrolase n=1 Tax=unclassified Sphingomonas TaxID=196159 RepID=UPI000BDB6681|nr:HAD-IB family phosphatase [Sphingomonas sp.]OYY76802.1 MAG: haloacid dehalogenase [Sphingomonas sp. 28-62-20]
MQDIAIYDMDKTITRAATWTPFLLYAARRRAPWRLALLPLLGGAGLGYAIGLVNRGQLKQIAFRLMLGRVVPAPAMAMLAAGFADKIAARGVWSAARAQIASDRAAGRRLVLATASFRCYVDPIAADLGFDAVIATESTHALDGGVTALIDGDNCYGMAKLDRISAWMADQGVARADATIAFYSDHVSDGPTLAWADRPYAVNPHPALRQLAAAEGWPVLDWTD